MNLLGTFSEPSLLRLGVCLALLLHLGISLTPSPNNATPFSLAMAARLLVTQAPALLGTV